MTGVPSHVDSDTLIYPIEMVDALRDYALRGLQPGGCMTAMLRLDFQDALLHAHSSLLAPLPSFSRAPDAIWRLRNSPVDELGVCPFTNTVNLVKALPPLMLGENVGWWMKEGGVEFMNLGVLFELRNQLDTCEVMHKLTYDHDKHPILLDIREKLTQRGEGQIVGGGNLFT